MFLVSIIVGLGVAEILILQSTTPTEWFLRKQFLAEPLELSYAISMCDK
jgi:hypothetical protein